MIWVTAKKSAPANTYKAEMPSKINNSEMAAYNTLRVPNNAKAAIPIKVTNPKKTIFNIIILLFTVQVLSNQ